MTLLTDALKVMGLEGTLEMDGTWLTLHGEHRMVYVAQVGEGCYLTWCGGALERAVELYTNLITAIYMGMLRGRRAP